MKKSVVVLLCLLAGIISCKTSSRSTDSSLTKITMIDISKDPLITEKMNSNEATKGKELNWFKLKIDNDISTSECFERINKEGTPSTIISNDITLKTKVNGVGCIYTMDLSLGRKEGENYTPYFEGSTDIGGATNPYSPNGTTSIEITLIFKLTGDSVRVDAAQAETTSLDIKVTAVKDAKYIKLKDLFSCKYIDDVKVSIVLPDKDKSLYNWNLLVEGDAATCINGNILTEAGFTGPETTSFRVENNAITAINYNPSSYELVITDALKAKLHNGTEYSIVEIDFHPDPLELQIDVPTKEKGNDTVDINSEKLIDIKYYKFKYSSSSTTLKIENTDYTTKAWKK